MYSVHCRVIVDNKSEFYHSSSSSRGLHGLMQDPRAKAEECSQALVQPQPGPEKASALSVIIAHLWALKVTASSKVGVRYFTKFRVAFCHCHCCHDPFIVRSAQNCPPITDFNQLVHPSRCSRSTLTTVCFCARASPRVSVFTSGLQHRHQIHHWLFTFIL